MSQEEFLSPNEIFELFTKEEKEYTIVDLAEDLKVPVEKLYDMTLDEISELSKNLANQKTLKVQKIIDKRNHAVDKVKEAQGEIKKEELTKIYFEDLKQHIH